jgi:hypothetical protein
MRKPSVQIRSCAPLRPGELFQFYERNNICEAQFGRERSEDVLKHPAVWIAAYDNDELIGFARALQDGLNGIIVELSLDLGYQDYNENEIGCFIDSDPHGIAEGMGTALLKELRKTGCTFFNVIVPEGQEQEDFYRRLGFSEHTGHRSYIIDARDYVPGGPERAAKIDACQPKTVLRRRT